MTYKIDLLLLIAHHLNEKIPIRIFRASAPLSQGALGNGFDSVTQCKYRYRASKEKLHSGLLFFLGVCKALCNCCNLSALICCLFSSDHFSDVKPVNFFLSFFLLL